MKTFDNFTRSKQETIIVDKIARSMVERDLDPFDTIMEWAKTIDGLEAALLEEMNRRDILYAQMFEAAPFPGYLANPAQGGGVGGWLGRMGQGVVGAGKNMIQNFQQASQQAGQQQAAQRAKNAIQDLVNYFHMNNTHTEAKPMLDRLWNNISAKPTDVTPMQPGQQQPGQQQPGQQQPGQQQPGNLPPGSENWSPEAKAQWAATRGKTVPPTQQRQRPPGGGVGSGGFG